MRRTTYLSAGQLAAGLVTAVLALATIALPAGAVPPDEGDCPEAGGPTDENGDGAADAAPLLLEPGMVLTHESLLALRSLLPAEIWQFREAFFHEGMRMEIGPCHRRYPVPEFFSEATEKYRGRTNLNDDGDLLIDHPGLPFPPATIEPEAEDAALRWAWNFARRFRGAALRGSFRVTDLPGRIGGIEVYEGRFFWLQLRNRTDLPDQDYRLPDAEDRLWVAGGRFTQPFNARHLSWRQFRTQGSLDTYETSDDIFVYVPEMRKMRRAATNWADGLFFPRYSVGGAGSGGGMAYGGGGAINPTAGQSLAVTEDGRTGLTGLMLRPNAYVWRMRGEQNVLAPINSNAGGYPDNPNRNFGPSGLSLASDRWDVRRAVIIEGATLRNDETVRTVTIYLDYLSQVPLYWITRTHKRRLVEIGVLAHRYSGDSLGYPSWPGGVAPQVFDPVAAAFYNVLESAGGWRRESYDMVSSPAPRDETRVMNSINVLDRGR